MGPNCFHILKHFVPKHTFDKDFFEVVSISKRSFVWEYALTEGVQEPPCVRPLCWGDTDKRASHGTKSPSPCKVVPGFGSWWVRG